MRLYLSAADFAETAMGAYWASVATDIQIARALANASRRVDSLVGYHLGLNGATTLSAPASIGDTALQVTSTLGFDAGAEASIQLDAANTLETPNITGVTVSTWGTPYPGTLQLATPLVASHLSGAVVQGFTQDTRIVRGRSSAQSDWDSALTQEAQMAIAHAPHDQGSDLVRNWTFRCSWSMTWPSTTVVHRRSPGCRCASTLARSTASSATTVPARARWSRSWAAWSSRIEARSGSAASRIDRATRGRHSVRASRWSIRR